LPAPPLESPKICEQQEVYKQAMRKCSIAFGTAASTPGLLLLPSSFLPFSLSLSLCLVFFPSQKFQTVTKQSSQRNPKIQTLKTSTVNAGRVEEEFEAHCIIHVLYYMYVYRLKHTVYECICMYTCISQKLLLP
jgi:hypothetical protein